MTNDMIFFKKISDLFSSKENLSPAIKEEPKATEKVKEIKPEIDLSIYEDNFGKFDMYSYMEPDEAKKELKRAKAEGQYLSNEEYFSLMDVIAGEKDDEYLDKIFALKDPAKVEAWFVKMKDNGKWLSSNVYAEISKILAPYHEEKILTELDNVTKGRADGYVTSKKKDGFFFTQKAYEKALAIKKGEIDNGKKAKEKRLSESKTSI
jgi:hypothetical protein